MRASLLSGCLFLILSQSACAQDTAAPTARDYLATLPRSFESFGGATEPRLRTVDNAYVCANGDYRFALSVGDASTSEGRSVRLAQMTTPWGEPGAEDVSRIDAALAEFRGVNEIMLRCDGEQRSHVVWLTGAAQIGGQELHVLFWFKGPVLERIQRP
jgi:hypothetical protein